MDAWHKLECCITEIQQWMTVNKLKLNGDKTDIILLSSSFHRGEIFSDNIQVSGVEICPASAARNLGVIFDNHLTLDAHVRKVCSTAYFHLRNISSIRGTFRLDLAVALVHASVSSRLDYCNSLLCGISNISLQKLQRVQNMAARMITRTRKRDHMWHLVWSGGLIDSRSAVGVYMCQLGRHSDAWWRGGNCVCCRLADASFVASVKFGLLER